MPEISYSISILQDDCISLPANAIGIGFQVWYPE
jgi:hypothetical protein